MLDILPRSLLLKYDASVVTYARCVLLALFSPKITDPFEEAGQNGDILRERKPQVPVHDLLGGKSSTIRQLRL